MLKYILSSIILFCASILYGQDYNPELSGVWQGLMVQRGMDWEKSYIIWMELKISPDGSIKAVTRDETPNTTYYALKNARGHVPDTNKNAVVLDQQFITEEKSGMSKYWCISKYELTYNSETGYLKGPWTSQDCRGTYGRVVFYKSKYPISKGDSVTLAHSWRDKFIKRLNGGEKSPQAKQRELANFEFKPVYFDYDKDSIRKKYKPYLKKMVDVVQGHTDLRIKIIGHTDSDGTNKYNDTLSEHRARRIKSFFIAQGLRSDRVVIEFRGELSPAATNKTDQGKQRNRRVDFKFI